MIHLSDLTYDRTLLLVEVASQAFDHPIVAIEDRGVRRGWCRRSKQWD